MKNTGTEYMSTERTPTVRPDFAELLPPLSDEQLSLLEADILKNGCYTPVIVNEDMVIVDGHNRASICDKHGVPYRMAVFSFEDDLEAKQWALDTQKSRRNLSINELCKIALKLRPDVEASVGFWDSIPLWIVTLLGSLIIWVLSLVMILTVYGRFFKIFMATAIAPIPLASFAGEPTANIGKSFIKTYAALCLQGCVIVLACVIFSVVASEEPTLGNMAGMSAVTITWQYIGELLFNMLVLVGTIKTSDRLIRELMGLS